MSRRKSVQRWRDYGRSARLVAPRVKPRTTAHRSPFWSGAQQTTEPLGAPISATTRSSAATHFVSDFVSTFVGSLVGSFVCNLVGSFHCDLAGVLVAHFVASLVNNLVCALANVFVARLVGHIVFRFTFAHFTAVTVEPNTSNAILVVALVHIDVIFFGLLFYQRNGLFDRTIFHVFPDRFDVVSYVARVHNIDRLIDCLSYRTSSRGSSIFRSL